MNIFFTLGIYFFTFLVLLRTVRFDELIRNDSNKYVNYNFTLKSSVVER